MYNIAYNKQKAVAEVLEFEPPNLEFRVTTIGQNEQERQDLITNLQQVELTTNPDHFVWTPVNGDKFMVKPMYDLLLNQNMIPVLNFTRNKDYI